VRTLLWTLLALAGAACSAPGDDAQGPAAALARELREQADLEDEVARMLARPLDESAAVRVALLSNRRVRAELERLDVARARVWQAGLLPNPGLALGARGEGEARSVELSLAQDVLSALLLPTRVELARAEEALVAAEVADALAEVALEARTQFLAAVASRTLEGLYARIEEASSSAAELARRMHAAGNLSDRDYVAEVDAFEEARLARAEAAAERVAAEERLRRALGVSPENGAWMLPSELTPLPEREASLAGLERRALEQRQDLAAAVRGSELAAGELGVARDWRLLGLLEVGGNAEREDGSWQVGPELALELPLFDRRSARRVELAAELARADHEVFALALEVRSQVREARERLRALRARAEHARDVRLPAREALVRLTQENYDFMLVGAFELLDARRAADEAHVAQVELLRDYWIARAALERAIGGPLADAELAAQDSVAAQGTQAEHGHHHGDH